MAKSPLKGRKLSRARNVPSLEESTVSAPRVATRVVTDVHHENEKSRQRDDDANDFLRETSGDKEAEQAERSSGFKDFPKRADRALRNQNVVVLQDRRFKDSRERLTMKSLDLIEEAETTSRGDGARTPEKRETESFPEVKPHQRKQWSTANAASETEDSRRPRKRWSKDTSVIRLPETNDDGPTDDSRKPIPAPRSRVRRNALFFDNPVFVSESEEVLRIETDQENTRIEMRRVSNNSNVEEDVERDETTGAFGGGYSSRGSDKGRSRECLGTSDTRSSNGRRSNLEELNSSSSLGKIIDVRSSLNTPKEVSSRERKKRSEAAQDRSSRKKRALFRKDPRSDEVNSVTDARSVDDVRTDETAGGKKQRKKRKPRRERREEEREETRYISVTIHRTDVLEVNYTSARQPMVKVHIVEARTGNYLRNARSSQENGRELLQPMITGKFDFKANRSIIPVWEEELIFEHDFDAITRREEDSQVVILFEVIDLLNFAEASFCYDKFGREECWNKIAWAFLKPVGINDTLHVDKKVRLQLYRPKQSYKKYGRHNCEVYTWWRSKNRDKYPSSLFVTVTSVPPPKLETVFYRQLALNDLSDVRNEDSRGFSTSDSISLPKWARLAAQSCKIPNEKMFETEASENGCFYVVFSSAGKYLACVHSEEYDYPIVVYEVETGKVHVRFLGHKVFVYSLNWSNDDRYLLSASADQTARIWDVRNQIVQHIEILPHPSYVYCAKYAPDSAAIVATGCYDHVARVWANDKRSRKPELSQELEGHEGFVNSLVFQRNGNLMTADSVGVIIIWTVRKNRRAPAKREWCVSKKLKVHEIEGIAINTIVLHPLESKLLVHSRNSGLRMLDLATGVVLQKYDQLHNEKIQSKACISPCGSLVLCGGEDSALNVWNLSTSKHLAKYTRERNYRAVTCVDYHPYNHVLAFSTFGSPASVQILRFNKDSNGSDVGLKITENEPQSDDNKLNRVNTLSELESSFRPHERHSAEMGRALVNCARNELVLIPDEEAQTAHPSLAARGLKRTNRLRHVIEKIDKMLLVMRLKQIQHPIIMDTEFAESDPCTKGNRARGMKERRFNETKLSMNDRSSVESISSPSSAAKKHPIIKARLKESARELPMDEFASQNGLELLSNSVANRAAFQPRDDLFSTLAVDTCENIAEINTSTRSREQNRSSSSDSTVVTIDGTNMSETPRESTSDSAGTYVISMVDHEANAEKNVSSNHHRFTDKRASDAERNEPTNSDVVSVVSQASDSSVSSRMTFVVESKTSASKSRRDSCENI